MNNSFNCKHYIFDKNVKAEQIKSELENRLMKFTKGVLTTNEVTFLIDDKVEIDKKIDTEISMTIRSSLTSNVITIILMGTLILFLFVLAFSSINGFLPGTFFFLGIATALIFVLKNKLLGKSSLVINKLGISYNDKLFHWRSIEGIYMIDTDGTDSSDRETVMMILFRSGEQYNLDFNKMGFYTNLKLKKYIDTYRKSSLEYKE